MSKTTILIVENEAIVAADLAGKLRQLGYGVVGIAAQGEEAVARVQRLCPQLVLMDIQLAGPMDGIEAAEAIRRRHDLPVIYLTAHSDAATLARAKLTGPFGYILKPFEERELATQIELALYKHQTDRQLREQREWLRVTLTSIGDAVIATDTAGCISFVNRASESLTGWKAEEVMGRPLPYMCHLVNEQTGEELEGPIARVLRDRRAPALANNTALVTRDGDTVPVEDSAAPILDAAGQVIGAVLVFHDVTEERRAEAALRESNQELAEYTYALTHSIKAPFRAIENYADFLSEDLADILESEPKQYLQGIKKAITQANNQFKDLEALYRIKNHSVSFEPFEIGELLNEMQSMFKNTSDKKLTIAQNWPVFRSERFLLRQIFIDLICNGFKYNRAAIKQVEVGWQKAGDNGVEIFVRDNGIGIDPQHHARITEIFKRLHTDGEYEGTGIGLAIVKRAVQKINGTLRVESAVGEGSTFYVNLPNSILESGSG